VTGPQDQFLIGPGDTLSIKLFYTSELNEEVTVRPDGGSRSSSWATCRSRGGRTPAQTSKELRERYAGYLTRPDVAVIMRGFASQRVFVGGEVRSPSVIMIDGRTTLAGAVFQAGGTLDTAATSSVILIRRKPDGLDVYRVDLSGGLEGEDPVPVLRSYDVVYVPKSFIAEVGMYVDLYINRIIPKQAMFTAFYAINPVNNNIGATTTP
jgi:polysaccharide export outer membrane protein